MTSFTKDGLIYGLVWSFGKPPSDLNLGLQGWDCTVYSSKRGRSIGISSLRKLNVDLLYTFEFTLQELIDRAKSNPQMPIDKKWLGRI